MEILCLGITAIAEIFVFNAGMWHKALNKYRSARNNPKYLYNNL